MLDAIFKAYDVRAVYPDPFNETCAWQVGVATGRFLKDQTFDGDPPKHADTIVVSRDMRPSGPALTEALIEGITASGMNVIDIGMCDTSFIYFAVNHLDCAGGIQVTASHNPIQYNGLKISKHQAKPIGAATGLNDIRDIAKTLGERGSIESTGQVTQRDLWLPYRDHVLQFLSTPNRPLKVVIDASNGMAGRMIPKLFDGYPNLEIIKINFEITGSFVHEPNPLVAENMKPTQDGVKEHNADLGVCFDGDADRCILTDEKGEIIGCDHLTAFLAESMLGHNAGSTVVYDLRSSKVVEETITQLGGTPMRGRVGHVFMKQALRESGGVFGGELSGHFYFRDNFFADSGAIAFAIALDVLGHGDTPMSELIGPFRKYPQSGEINFEVEDKQAVLDTLKADYGSQGTVDELDGVSIDAWDTAGWWINVRASNTEPLLRFNAEAKTQDGLDQLLSEITPKIGTPAEGH